MYIHLRNIKRYTGKSKFFCYRLSQGLSAAAVVLHTWESEIRAILDSVISMPPSQSAFVLSLLSEYLLFFSLLFLFDQTRTLAGISDERASLISPAYCHRLLMQTRLLGSGRCGETKKRLRTFFVSLYPSEKKNTGHRAKKKE